MKNRSVGKSPFEIVYTKLPRSTVEFANIPSSTDPSIEVESMAERVAELHKEVIEHLEKMNVKYKTEVDQHRRFK